MRLLIALPSDVEGEPPILHDTGMEGMVWNGDFLVPFHDEMTADEVARIVANAIRSIES